MELSIILVCILLLVLFLPALSHAESAKKSLCASHLKQLGQAHSNYTMDNEKRILVACDSATNPHYPTRYSILYEGGYTPEPELLLCPSAPKSEPYGQPSPHLRPGPGSRFEATPTMCTGPRPGSSCTIRTIRRPTI